MLILLFILIFILSSNTEIWMNWKFSFERYMVIFPKVNNLTNLTNLIDLTSDFRENSIVFLLVFIHRLIKVCCCDTFCISLDLVIYFLTWAFSSSPRENWGYLGSTGWYNPDNITPYTQIVIYFHDLWMRQVSVNRICLMTHLWKVEDKI